MNSLNLRINKYLDSDGGSPPAVFATISAIEPESGRKRPNQTLRRELVPISSDSHDFRSIGLNPGHYVVEVKMPSGEILSDWVEMRTGRDSDLVLEAEDSTHEWLGWQHLMGNVAGEASRVPVRKRVATRQRSKAHLPSKIHCLFSPIFSRNGPPVHDVWSGFGRLPSTVESLTALLNVSKAPQVIPQYRRDDQLAIYRVVHGSKPVSGAVPLGGDMLARTFIIVPRREMVRQRGAIELVSLPTPWIVLSGTLGAPEREAFTERQAVVEIVVQHVSHANDFATSLTVRDDRLGVLLGYLSSGALSAVKEIAETAKGMLYGKTTNALAAAAAGYAMLGTAFDDKPRDWHTWIRNLCDWFPHIPDGAIQLAHLHLRLRRKREDFAEALRWLSEGYRRGLPFYSMGVRWLLEDLEKVAPSEPEAERMLQAVRNIAWRIHPQSPFTILRLGDR